MKCVLTDRVLTGDRRLARVEQVDIVEGTRRRRLVIAVVQTHTKRQCNSCSGCQHSRSGCWSVGTPSPMSSLFLGITKSPAKRGREDVC